VLELLADAGYDAESSHERGRRDLGVATIIPPKIGRPSAKPPKGRWRRQMRRRWRRHYENHYEKRYGQRWQIKTFNRMTKHNEGSALPARRYHSRCREIRLRCLTHNLRILDHLRGLRQSRSRPILDFRRSRGESGAITRVRRTHTVCVDPGDRSAIPSASSPASTALAV
jgi:hypothetical protein